MWTAVKAAAQEKELLPLVGPEASLGKHSLPVPVEQIPNIDEEVLVKPLRALETAVKECKGKKSSTDIAGAAASNEMAVICRNV